ncbi:hypothetical protein BDN71DRAFT_775637 [Pleurotus eryngii]|uniref:Uncharacterized protein n=1 Tax=Pleurotus eryngii TaxID=5323 RepID=A0A9P5ZYD4_PLEER|nr:hypothetical protein BDN71DRAFT_775637 [Pleurotus eryngii]
MRTGVYYSLSPYNLHTAGGRTSGLGHSRRWLYSSTPTKTKGVICAGRSKEEPKHDITLGPTLLEYLVGFTERQVANPRGMLTVTVLLTWNAGECVYLLVRYRLPHAGTVP